MYIEGFYINFITYLVEKNDGDNYYFLKFIKKKIYKIILGM